jgi:hypothetical protein
MIGRVDQEANLPDDADVLLDLCEEAPGEKPIIALCAPAHAVEARCRLDIIALKHLTILGMPAGAAPTTRPQCN